MAYFEKLDISVFSFFDESPDPMIVFGEEQIIFVNKFLLDNFQFEFKKWQEFVNSSQSQNELYRFFLGGEIPKSGFLRTLRGNNGYLSRFDWTFVNLSSNTSKRYCLAKGKPHFSLGEIMYANKIGTHTIAENKDVRFIETILRNSHDMLAILDNNGVYKFISSSIIDKLGFNPENVIGGSVDDFIENGLIQLVEGDLSNLWTGKDEVKINFWVKRPDGRKVFLESYAKNLMDDPAIEGILFSARDITDYYEAKKSLEKRFELEILINKISAKFVNADFQQLDQVFLESLRMLGEFEQADRAYIFLIHRELQTMEYVYEWTNEGVEPQIDVMKYIYIDDDAYTMKTLQKGEIMVIPDVETMPECLSHEQEVYRKQGIKSVILIPIFSENRLIGFFGLDAVKEQREWAEKDEYVLRQLGDIYAGSFINRAIRKSLDRNEKLLASTEILAKSGSWRYSDSRNRLVFSKGLNRIFELGDHINSAEIAELLDVIDGQSKRELLKKLRVAFFEKQGSEGEFYLKLSDGREKVISYNIEVKQLPGSSKTEIFGYCTDITHKRDAENYLKLQSQILAQVDDPIFVTDIHWNVIYLNKAAKQECDLGQQEQFQGLLFELFDFLSEDIADIQSEILGLNTTEVYERELNLKPLNGTVQPYDLMVQAFLNDEGKKLGYSFLIRNLSALQKQEALAKRAKMVVENSPAVLFTVDPNDRFKILYISENIKQFGYQAQDLIGKISLLELIHPDDVEDLLDFHLKEEDDRGVPAYSGEYRLKKMTGEYRWVEDKSREILDQEGRVVLHEGILQDITERKKAREEILRSQERYRVLAANIPFISVFLIDKDLRYIVAQGSNLDDWGMKPSDFEGKSLSEVHKRNLNEIEPAVNEALHHKKGVNKILVFRRRYYEMTVKPIMHGEDVEYALGILRDINEEYKAKENLKKSEEKYRRLVEESTEIIFSLQTDFSISYISPNVKQFLGYDLDEVLNRKLTDFLHQVDNLELEDMARNPLQFLEQNQYLEFKLRRKDGQYRIFSSNGKIVYGEDGKISYNGIARDITLLKEAQRELYSAKEKAEQASKIKSQFLSIMSHEIRTPMNAVIGMAHLLIEDNPRPDQLENLKTLQFSAENLLGLINDILDFTKIDSGKVELEHVDFELKNVINRIIHSYTYQAREKALEIIFEYDEEIPFKLLGDPVRLGQIVNNLVSNAVKFTPKGFIRIALKRMDENSEEIAIKFDFEDTGIGIPKEKSESIFDAFTQASAETTRKFGGTGLGLAIVKKLVDLFGGKIQVKPRIGGGTVFTFVIRFQKTKEFKGIDYQQIAASEKDLQQAKILVAEDNLVNQVMINKFLMKWGVNEVVIAENGQEAIQEFDKCDFHLVLLDLQMPEMDGFEVASYIRSHFDLKKRSIPIIALTASSLIDVKQQLDEVGMDDFIPKPFNPDNLYAKIIKYLNI